MNDFFHNKIDPLLSSSLELTALCLRGFETKFFQQRPNKSRVRSSMQTLQLTYLSRTLGVPCLKRRLATAWTPRDDNAWALHFEIDAATLYKVGTNGFAIVTPGVTALGLDGVSAVHALFTAPDGSLRVVASDLSGTGVLVLRGARFERLDVELPPVSSADAFCNDAESGRLFLARAATGEVLVLEQDTLKPFGSFNEPLSSLLLVWDRALRSLVAVARTNGRQLKTLTLDSQQLSLIEGELDLELHNVRDDVSDKASLATDPGSGSALLLPFPAPWSVSPAKTPFILARHAWRPLECDPTPHALSYVSRRADVVAWGAARIPTQTEVSRSNTEPRCEWARFDGTRWARHGRMVPEGIKVFARTQPTRVASDWSSGVSPLSATGELQEPLVIEGGRDAVETPEGLLVVCKDTVTVVNQGTLKTFDRTATIADEAALTWAGELGVLAIGGNAGDPYRPDPVATTLVFQQGDWVALKTKKKPFKQYNGHCVFDEARSRVVLIGGVDKKGSVDKTAELAGKVWSNFDEPLPWGRRAPVKLAAFDAPTGQVFVVAAVEPDNDKTGYFGLELFRYAGNGQWHKEALLRFEDPGARGFRTSSASFCVGFEAAARRIICLGSVDDGSGTNGVLAAEIGPLLDNWAVPAHQGPASTGSLRPPSGRPASGNTTGAGVKGGGV